MRKITMNDISKRKKSRMCQQTKPLINANKIYENALSATSFAQLSPYIHNWRNMSYTLSESYLKFAKVFENFCYLSESVSDISKLARILIEAGEDVDNKTSSTASDIADRAAKNLGDVAKAAENVKDKAKSNLDKNMDKIKTNVNKSPKVKAALEKLKQKNQASDRAAKAKEASLGLKETAEITKICNRIISNNNKIAKRFNLDKILYEGKAKSIAEVVYEFGDLIDTYNMSKSIKLNSLIETAFYLFNKHNIQYTDNELLEAATDYFLIKYADSDDKLDIIKSVLEQTKVVDTALCDSIDYIEDETMDPIDIYDKYFNHDKDNVSMNVKSIPESFSAIMEEAKQNKMTKILDDLKKVKIDKKFNIKPFISRMYSCTPKEIIDGTPNYFAWARKIALFSIAMSSLPVGFILGFTDAFVAMKVKRDEANAMLKNYEHEKKRINSAIDRATDKDRKDRLKKQLDAIEDGYDKIKDYRDRLYTEKELDEEREKEYTEAAQSDFDKVNIDDIDTDYLFDLLIRLNFVANDIVFDKYTNGIFTPKYNNDELIENIKNSLTSKGFIQIPILLIYHNDPCNSSELSDTEKESECKIHNEHLEIIKNIFEKEIKDKDNYYISNVHAGDEIVWYYLCSNFGILNADTDNSTVIQPDLAIEYAIVMNLANNVESIKNSMIKINESNNSYIDKYDVETLDYLSEIAMRCDKSIIDKNNLLLAMKRRYRNIMNESDSIAKYYDSYALSNSIRKLENCKIQEHSNSSLYNEIDTYKTIMEMLSIVAEESITENSFTNTLELAKEKLKKAMVDLSDKDKQLSRELDTSVDNVKRGVEKAVESESREAVIKGNLLPSASKTIKTALLTGAAWAVNPALAIIGVVAGIGLSRKTRKKERQLILDEIDTELVMCEKHLQKADSEGDLEAYRQCLQIKKKLQRERIRLKYRMKVSLGEKPELKNSEGDD